MFRHLWARRKGLRKPSVKELVAELEAVAKNYDSATCGTNENICTVSFDTKEIVLQDTNGERHNMGRFRVVIEVDPKCHSVSLSAEALDPNCPSHNDSVTHPHVQNDGVCMGKGSAPFNKAANSGRLFDACEIVSAVLNTYNSGSPYVALESWNGFSCGNCGHLHEDEDGAYGCSRCHEDACDECTYSCCGCDNRLHTSCGENCDGCDEFYCPHCLTEANGSNVCGGCLAKCSNCRCKFNKNDLDENGNCEECQESFEEDDDDGEEDEEEAAVVAPACGGAADGAPCRTCAGRFVPEKLFRDECAACYAAGG